MISVLYISYLLLRKSLITWVATESLFGATEIRSQVAHIELINRIATKSDTYSFSVFDVIVNTSKFIVITSKITTQKIIPIV